ncbi:MAG: AAA family ATPase, partial [Clostridia bacterium]|nr:AAA family ATPase [Clostridia bacterium]
FLRSAKEQDLTLDTAIKDFSTGMRAKLRVLTAVSHKADLLILDEPTAGLDVVAREDILDILRAYMEEDENRAILITSHISSDLEGLCDDIYMIHNGKVVLHEDTDVLLGKYAVLKVNLEQYESLDRAYIVKEKKTKYGYTLLTNEKQYYLDNFRDIVVENGTIDDLILMIAKKEDKK